MTVAGHNDVAERKDRCEVRSAGDIERVPGALAFALAQVFDVRVSTWSECA
jgi:hypothetical protein